MYEEILNEGVARIHNLIEKWHLYTHTVNVCVPFWQFERRDLKMRARLQSDLTKILVSCVEAGQNFIVKGSTDMHIVLNKDVCTLCFKLLYPPSYF